MGGFFSKPSAPAPAPAPAIKAPSAATILSTASDEVVSGTTSDAAKKAKQRALLGGSESTSNTLLGG